MANKRIDELSAAASVASTDLIFVGNPSTGELKKATANLIKPIEVIRFPTVFNNNDGSTYYFGYLGIAAALDVTTNDRFNMYVTRDCVIKSAKIKAYFPGSGANQGTNEAWSVYIIKNHTTDTLIETVSVQAANRTWTNESLNISMSAGDHFLVKVVNPTWATNPTSINQGPVVIILEY